MDILEPSLTSLIVKSYDGDIDEDGRGCYDGSGTATLDNDVVYDGEFCMGILHGIGALSWPDGVVYEGQFFKGAITGKGMYRWPDGSTYSGDVVDGDKDKR